MYEIQKGGKKNFRHLGNILLGIIKNTSLENIIDADPNSNFQKIFLCLKFEFIQTRVVLIRGTSPIVKIIKNF